MPGDGLDLLRVSQRIFSEYCGSSSRTLSHDTDRQEFLADINAAHRSITAGIIGASSR
jgi:hypothetical protein